MGLSFGEVLRELRKEKRITQKELAKKIGVHYNSLGGWERGDCLPESKTLVLELARQLHLETDKMQRLLEASLTAITPYWNVPFQRNLWFTGRDQLLKDLHKHLRPGKALPLFASCALCGLPGIGKTQTAIEYAYRHYQQYTATFWIKAENTEMLTASLLSIAEMLNLPEKYESDVNKAVQAVKRWLNAHKDWLLIIDNVEDVELVKSILPNARQGAFLFTTRRHTLGVIAESIEMTQMSLEEGTLFLLHRAKRLHSNTSPIQIEPDTSAAESIVDALGGLPLALDQAGAYIDENRCTFSDFMRLISLHPRRVLNTYETYADHMPVIETFGLVFEQLRRCAPDAADLLTLCAFLAPDAIPEVMLIQQASALGTPLQAMVVDPFQFNSMLKELLTYSLLQRHPSTQTLIIHRLIQEILKWYLDEPTQQVWRARAIAMVNQAFPTDCMNIKNWPYCEQLLPHALLVIRSGELQERTSHDVRSLLLKTASYLSERMRYTEAEALYQGLLGLQEQDQERDLMEIASTLYGLATVYAAAEQGKWKEAEQLYHRVLHLWDQEQNQDYLRVALSLNGLALLYLSHGGELNEVEILLQQAMQIWEQKLSTSHPLFANLLNSLGNLYRRVGKFDEAVFCYRRALSVQEAVLGGEHPRLAKHLNNLATVYAQQSNFAEAEPLFRQVLQITEQQAGPQSPQLACAFNNLGEVCREQGRYEEARFMLSQSLDIWEQAFGEDHPQVTLPLGNLAELAMEQGEEAEAERLYHRALQILEEAQLSEQITVTYQLTGLANLYFQQHRDEEAELLYRRALHIWEQFPGVIDVDMVPLLSSLALLCMKYDKGEEAKSLIERAMHIQERVLGADHSKTRKTREHYQNLLQSLNKGD